MAKRLLFVEKHESLHQVIVLATDAHITHLLKFKNITKIPNTHTDAHVFCPLVLVFSWLACVCVCVC